MKKGLYFHVIEYFKGKDIEFMDNNSKEKLEEDEEEM